MNENFIKKITMLEYEYIEDSDSYDRIQVLRNELLNKFLNKHDTLLSAFQILFQLVSIMLIVFSVMQFKGLIILVGVAAIVFISDYNGKKNYKQKQETAFLDRQADYYSDVLSEGEFATERKIFNYTDYLNKKFINANKTLINEAQKTKFKNMLCLESSSFFTLLIFIYFIISLSQSVVADLISIGLLIATVKQLQTFLEIIRWQLYSVLEIKYEGEILLLQKPLLQIPQKIISEKFSVVFQDYAHYYLTLKENILIGNLNTTESKIQKAINLFSLDEVAKSLDEQAVLNKGDKFNADLSGGQWQNLAMARSYVSDAEILIFDEPTSALDPETEAAVIYELKKISQNKTTVVVTHRLSFAKNADLILVLKDGEQIELGTFDELMNSKNYFYKMFSSQASWYK